MSERELALTTAEWHVMECLWEGSPRSGREAVEYMSKSVGWTRSTTLTMLRRMSEKGIICCEEAEGLKVYSPLIDRDKAVIRETENFLSRVYHGSVGLMLSSIAEKTTLCDSEIEQLYDILKKAEEGRKI